MPARPPRLSKRAGGPKPPPLPRSRSRAPLTSVPSAPRAWAESAPEIAVGYAPVGRETLAAIAEELGSESDALLDEGELAAQAPAEGGAAGRDTMSELAEELLREPPPPAAPARRRRRTVGYEDEGHGGAPAPKELAAAALDVYEMLTFVVRGPEVGRLASKSARRELVAGPLRSRLPVQSLEDVHRIDVVPWTEKGTVVVRVWCKLR